MNEYKFRKIEKYEFDKLQKLFPDDNHKWSKYRIKRLEQFDVFDIDIYVIEYNNEFIGEVSVNYSNHELETETIPGVRVYFEAFRLLEKYQGLGLGQKLLDYALNDLAKVGYTEFTIGVEDDNEVAKHIYSKLGFTKLIDHGKGNEYDLDGYNLYLKKN